MRILRKIPFQVPTITRTRSRFRFFTQSPTPEKGFSLNFSLNFNISFFFAFPALNSTAMNKKLKSSIFWKIPYNLGLINRNCSCTSIWIYNCGSYRLHVRFQKGVKRFLMQRDRFNFSGFTCFNILFSQRVSSFYFNMSVHAFITFGMQIYYRIRNWNISVF